MLRLRFCHDPGLTLAISVQRSDGSLFDFADGKYKSATPTTQTLPCVEGSGIFRGRYSVTYGPTPGGVWYRGPHIITLHHLDPAGPTAIGETAADFKDGENTIEYPPFVSF